MFELQCPEPWTKRTWIDSILATIFKPTRRVDPRSDEMDESKRRAVTIYQMLVVCQSKVWSRLTVSDYWLAVYQYMVCDQVLSEHHIINEPSDITTGQFSLPLLGIRLTGASWARSGVAHLSALLRTNTVSTAGAFFLILVTALPHRSEVHRLVGQLSFWNKRYRFCH